MAMRPLETFTPFIGKAANQNGRPTAAQLHFIELDKKKAEIKAFFEEYNQAVKAVVDQVGIGSYFQDEEGTVYKTVKPAGTFVTFQDFAVDRTRRMGETKGSLSMAEAIRAGFTPAENKPEKAVEVSA